MEPPIRHSKSNRIESNHFDSNAEKFIILVHRLRAENSKAKFNWMQQGNGVG